MNRISFLTGVFALGASLLPAAYQSPPAAGQQPTGPQLTFRVETNYIEVDAIVTDGRGNVVRDLKREDFTLFEDGKPQAVDAFAFIDIPFERADPLLHRDDEVDPDVFTNERDFEGRIYLIVLDSYHVAAVRTQQTRQVVRDFILNNVAANDSAAVVHVGRTDISQEFTSNKRLLLRSVDKFMGQKLQSKVLNKFENVQSAAASDREPQDFDWQERIGNGTGHGGVARQAVGLHDGHSGPAEIRDLRQRVVRLRHRRPRRDVQDHVRIGSGRARVELDARGAGNWRCRARHAGDARSRDARQYRGVFRRSPRTRGRL